MYTTIMYVATGLFIGLMVGLTGIGGSALMAPALVLLFRVPPSVAVGTDLAYSIPTKWVGMWQHYRKKHIRWDIVWHLGKGSVPAAIVAAYTVTRWVQMTPHAETSLRHLLGVILFVVGLVILAHLLFRSQLTQWIPRRWWHEHPWVMIGWGIIVGMFVGSTSIGSGTLLIPYLYLLRLKAREIVGTGVALSALLVTVAGGIYWWGGTVDMRLTIYLLTGSLPGVILGTRLSQRFPDRGLRFVLAILLLATALHLARR